MDLIIKGNLEDTFFIFNRTGLFMSAEINAKGVILKAFEQYRLKTCIDFQPWNGEKNYISIFKGGG